jgi:radical SAM protein with 4Fe4S-binding SPASM domain
LIREVSIALTNRCTMRCLMCEIPAGAADELSSADVKKAISDAAALGAGTVVLCGGEPLLREDLVDLVAFGAGHGLGMCLTTNGTLLDEKMAQRLAAARIKVVNVSLEGKKETHELLRAAGSFDKAIQALECLRRANVESTVACTVSRYNFRELCAVVEMAKKHGATTVLFQPFSTLFLRDQRKAGGFFLQSGERDALAEEVEKAIVLLKRYGLASNPASYLRKIPGYLAGEPLERKYGCASLSQACAINAQGEVYACWVLGGESRGLLGKIPQSRLKDIWGNAAHEGLRLELLVRGCGGCLMSCYPDAFDDPGIVRAISRGATGISAGEFFRRAWRRICRASAAFSTRMGIRARYYASSTRPGRVWRALAARLKCAMRTRIPRPRRSDIPVSVRAREELSRIHEAARRLQRAIDECT